MQTPNTTPARLPLPHLDLNRLKAASAITAALGALPPAERGMLHDLLRSLLPLVPPLQMGGPGWEARAAGPALHYPRVHPANCFQRARCHFLPSRAVPDTHHQRAPVMYNQVFGAPPELRLICCHAGCQLLWGQGGQMLAAQLCSGSA